MVAPKARAIDLHQVQELLTQGFTQRQIAQQLQIPESTLRHRLKNGLSQVDQGTPRVSPPEEYLGRPMSLEGRPEGDQGRPVACTPEGDVGRPTAQTAAHPPEGDLGPRPLEGGPEGDQEIPPLYVHPGIPDSSTEESVPAVDGSEPSPQATPSLSFEGRPQDHPGLPPPALSPQLAEALTLAWPDLQSLLAWWRDRQPQGEDADTPARKLARQTYHVEQRYIEAVKREADLTGESYAAVVNRAFAQYFAGRAPHVDLGRGLP
jgi:hypothetical protein